MFNLFDTFIIFGSRTVRVLVMYVNNVRRHVQQFYDPLQVYVFYCIFVGRYGSTKVLSYEGNNTEISSPSYKFLDSQLATYLQLHVYTRSLASLASQHKHLSCQLSLVQQLDQLLASYFRTTQLDSQQQLASYKVHTQATRTVATKLLSRFQVGGLEGGFRTHHRKPFTRPPKISIDCEGISCVMYNVVTKFQIDPRSDGAWARTKVRFLRFRLNSHTNFVLFLKSRITPP